MRSTRQALAMGLVVACTVALAGCGKGQAPKQNVAGGQVLPGSASDAMLPLDSVTSQPPLAPKSSTEGGGKSAKAAKGAETAAGDATPAANAPETPAKPEG